MPILFSIIQILSISWACFNIAGDIILVQRKTWCLLSAKEPDVDGFFTPHKYFALAALIMLSFYLPKLIGV